VEAFDRHEEDRAGEEEHEGERDEDGPDVEPGRADDSDLEDELRVALVPAHDRRGALPGADARDGEPGVVVLLVEAPLVRVRLEDDEVATGLEALDANLE